MTEKPDIDEFGGVESGFQIFVSSNDKSIGEALDFDETIKFHNVRFINWYTGREYTIELPKYFHKQAQVKVWCLANCSGPVAYQINNSSSWPDQMYFFFEEDAVAFKLRWL